MSEDRELEVKRQKEALVDIEEQFKKTTLKLEELEVLFILITFTYSQLNLYYMIKPFFLNLVRVANWNLKIREKPLRK